MAKSMTSGGGKRKRKGKRQRQRERKAKQLGNLRDQIFQSEKGLERLRKERLKLLRMYAGGHRMDQEMDLSMNVFAKVMSSMAANIAAQDPVADINARNSSLFQDIAKLMSVRLTHRARELRLRDSFRLVLYDAMTFAGIMKTGRKPSDGGFEWDGEWVDPGEPYASRVSPDDYGIDPTARHKSEAQFEYHRYRTTAEYLLDNRIVTKEELKRLPRWGESNSPEKAEEMDKNRRETMGGVQEWIDLIDVYVAPGVMSREPLIITLPGDLSAPGNLGSSLGIKMLREVEASVPEGGPYTLFQFNPIPDQVFGSAPAGFWYDTTKTLNAIYNHITDSETKRKSLLLYNMQRVDEGEVDAIRDAESWDAIGVNDVQDYLPTEMGGSTESAQRALFMFMQLFAQDSNSDLLTGVGADRGREVTATEVQQTSSSLASKLQDMTSTFYESADEVFRKMAWEEFFENHLLDTTVILERAGVQIPVRMTSEMMREADMFDFHFSVKRGSMQRVDDKDKARFVQQWAASIPPLAAQLGQIGMDPIELMLMTSEGVFDRADIERLLPHPELLREGVQITQQGGSQNTPNIGSAGGGLPGSPQQRNSSLTGSSSPNFDANENTRRTVESVGGGGA